MPQPLAHEEISNVEPDYADHDEINQRDFKEETIEDGNQDEHKDEMEQQMTEKIAEAAKTEMLKSHSNTERMTIQSQDMSLMEPESNLRTEVKFRIS